MNRIHTAHSLLPLFALLAQLSVSTPVVATDEVPRTTWDFGDCANNCKWDKTECGNNEDMWTRVREEISYCECTECSSKRRCDYVDKSHEWVLRPGEPGKNNYTLFAAGHRILGIECDNSRDTNEPDYWVSAWGAGKYHLGSHYPDKIGLAINSKTARSHNQLHIHVSCIDKKVHDELDKTDNWDKIAKKPEQWKTSTPLDLRATNQTNSHKWYVLFLDAQTPHYDKQNLFQLLWQHGLVSQEDREMAKQNLVVAVRTLSPKGFYILKGLDTGETASGGPGGEACLMKTVPGDDSDR